jgi:hypothetical protein
MSFDPAGGPAGSGPDHIDFPGSGPGRRRRHGRLLPVLGVAVVALAAGGGIAYVAQHSGSTALADTSSAAQSRTPSATPSPSAPARPGFRRGSGALGLGGPGLGILGLGGFGGTIHGQVTQQMPGGGYQTLDIQRGTVTDVSSSSISVRSADGFTANYAVTSSTEVNAQAAGIGSVKQGDNVEVVATVSNSTATAASIIDATSIRSSRGSFGFPVGPPGGTRPRATQAPATPS